MLPNDRVYWNSGGRCSGVIQSITGDLAIVELDYVDTGTTRTLYGNGTLVPIPTPCFFSPEPQFQKESWPEHDEESERKRQIDALYKLATKMLKRRK